MVQRDVLTNVDGRLDHMDLDPAAASSTSPPIATTPSKSFTFRTAPRDSRSPIFRSRRASLFIPDSRRVAVACDASVRVFKADEAGRLTPERSVEFTGRPDNIRYDPEAKRVYVGRAEALGSFDVNTGREGPRDQAPRSSPRRSSSSRAPTATSSMSPPRAP